MTAINREYIYSVSLKIINVIYLKWITKTFVYKLVMNLGVLFYYLMYEYMLKTLIWYIHKCFDTAYFDLVNKTLIKSIMVAVDMGYGGSPFPDTAYPVPDVYMRHLSNVIKFGILFVHLSTSLDVSVHGIPFLNNGEFQALQLVLIATFGVWMYHFPLVW